MIYWSIFNGKASKSSYRYKGYELWFIQRCKTFQTISIDFVVHVSCYISFEVLLKFRRLQNKYYKLSEDWDALSVMKRRLWKRMQFSTTLYLALLKEKCLYYMRCILRRTRVRSFIPRILALDSFLFTRLSSALVSKETGAINSSLSLLTSSGYMFSAFREIIIEPPLMLS